MSTEYKSKRNKILCPFEKIFPSELDRGDLFFMKLAYNQAIDAWRVDEVPVGAVVAQRGMVLAAAHNQVEATQDPTAHAEILALGQAARKLGTWRLKDCWLYVTKEPCPMCSGAAIMARVDGVAFGLNDPKMGYLGGALGAHEPKSLNHQIKVRGGLLEAECGELLRAYFKMKR